MQKASEKPSSRKTLCTQNQVIKGKRKCEVSWLALETSRSSGMSGGVIENSGCVCVCAHAWHRPGHPIPRQVYSPFHHTGSLLSQASRPSSHFPRGSHDLLIADLNVRLLTSDGVNALEPPLQIVAGLLQGARVVSVLTLVDV